MGGEQALELIGTRAQWSIIMCDMKMPGLSGVELHARLLAAFPETEPALHFMTGDSWSLENRDLLRELDRLHLDKPFSIDEFERFVEDNARP